MRRITFLRFPQHFFQEQTYFAGSFPSFFICKATTFIHIGLYFHLDICFQKVWQQNQTLCLRRPLSQNFPSIDRLRINNSRRLSYNYRLRNLFRIEKKRTNKIPRVVYFDNYRYYCIAAIQHQGQLSGCKLFLTHGHPRTA